MEYEGGQITSFWAAAEGSEQIEREGDGAGLEVEPEVAIERYGETREP